MYPWITRPFLDDFNYPYEFNITRRDRKKGARHGVTKRCYGWSIVPTYMSPDAGGGGGIAGSQPMSTNVHNKWSPNKFGDIIPYLTYGVQWVHGVVGTERSVTARGRACTTKVQPCRSAAELLSPSRDQNCPHKTGRDKEGRRPDKQRRRDSALWLDAPPGGWGRRTGQKGRTGGRR